MSKVVAVIPTLKTDCAAESLRAVASALLLEDVANSVSGAFPGVVDGLRLGELEPFDDFFRVDFAKAIERAADGTTKLQALQLQPGDRYMELVAAIADHADLHVARVRHGWPILARKSEGLSVDGLSRPSSPPAHPVGWGSRT